ncbi:hypothetical protein RHGRI_025197 [Rhododendron griersonianum]|uniref:Uncharacterized protein n=1 Tax=Rhododendron griersonianum TaxID=479676 RepID=A0AAV6JF55_9ERIC|nr:hypothetical protein RHGRI_025197 [Rhododendron griersonianum]
MAKLNSFILTLWFLILPISCSLRECRRRQPGQVEEGGSAALYVFGDSFLDSGNNDYINTTALYLANFWPYGETFFHFPTGRFSDGRLMSDFIAEYAKLPLTRPFLQPGIEKDYYYFKSGVNFASAGAGALVGTFQGLVISLSEQLNFYRKVVGGLRQKLGDVESKKTLSKAVYLFSIGTNDYTSIFLQNSNILSHYSKSTYVGMVIGNLTIAIRKKEDWPSANEKNDKRLYSEWSNVQISQKPPNIPNHLRGNLLIRLLKMVKYEPLTSVKYPRKL